MEKGLNNLVAEYEWVIGYCMLTKYSKRDFQTRIFNMS